jgi:hypothetical protein
MQGRVYGPVGKVEDLLGASFELLDDRIPVHSTIGNDRKQQ